MMPSSRLCSTASELIEAKPSQLPEVPSRKGLPPADARMIKAAVQEAGGRLKTLQQRLQ